MLSGGGGISGDLRDGDISGALRKEHPYVQGVASRSVLTWPSWEEKLER